MISRETLIEECVKEAKSCTKCDGSGYRWGIQDDLPIACPECKGSCASLGDITCYRCNGTGKVYVSVGGGWAGYEDEERPCPDCKPSKPSPYSSDGYLLNCPRCGASLCIEEWHDCNY
jgi:RecJ-like exonuclease